MMLNLKAHEHVDIETCKKMTVEKAVKMKRNYNLKQLDDTSDEALEKLTANYTEEDWRTALMEYDFPEAFLSGVSR